MESQAFADQVETTTRSLSTWENTPESVPRVAFQRRLDELVARASPTQKLRFQQLLTATEVDESLALLLPPEPLRHPVDGRPMVIIPEGATPLGPDGTPMWQAAYAIDVHPVTNAAYSVFTDATGHRPPLHWPDGHPDPEIAELPVVYVTHGDASAYAVWAGKTLPTRQQWEKAAAGPAGSPYPWGTAPSTAKANVREAGIGYLTPIGRYHSGASCYGVYDLAGGVWEWCADQTSPGRFGLKGGAFTTSIRRAVAQLDNDADEAMHDDDTGFRCAADPAYL